MWGITLRTVCVVIEEGRMMFTLTYSSMKNLRSCPRLFELSTIMGIRVPQTDAMSVGSNVHAEYEYRFSGKKPKFKDAFREAMAQGIVNAIFNNMDTEKLKSYKSEMELTRDHGGITIAGKVDMFDGERHIIELKCTQKNKAEFIGSRQPNLYAWLLGLEYGTITYILAPRPTIKPRAKETPAEFKERVLEWCSGGKVSIFDMPITAQRLRDVEKYIDESIGLLNFFLQSSFPSNDDYCENKYGTCKYSRMCKLSDPRLLVDNISYYIDKPNPELTIDTSSTRSSCPHSIISSGVLKDMDPNMRLMALAKAVLHDVEKRNLEVNDLKNLGIVGTRKALAMLDKIRNADMSEYAGERQIGVQDIDVDTQAMDVANKYNVLASQLNLVPYKISTSNLKKISRTSIINCWDSIEARIANSMFLRGQNTTFKVSMNWLVRNLNWKKVLDGRYDDKRGTDQ